MTDNTGKITPGFGKDVDPDLDQDKEVTPEPTSLTAEELSRILKRDTHAQAHIERLEAEAREREEMLAELQRQVEEKAKLEAFERARLESEEQDTDKTTPVIDADELVNKVQERLANIQAAEIAKANYEEAVKWARNTYGEGFSDKVEEKATALGMTTEDAIALASKSPEAFKSLFSAGNVTPPSGSTTSGVNSLGVREEINRSVDSSKFIQNYREKGFRALGTFEAFEAFKGN